MIVEDSLEGLEMYSQALEVQGYRVLRAGDGAAAVRIAISDPPDMIVMNLQLPLVNGVDATEILKGHPATEHVPVLVVSGHMSPVIREEAWTAGCDDYLDKPVTPTRLVEAIAERIGPSG